MAELDQVDAALREVGVQDEELQELGDLIRVTAADVALRPRLEELVTALTSQVGRIMERGSVFEDADFNVGPVGRGALPLLALLRARGATDEYLLGRHLPENIRCDTIAEIGRQTTKTHLVRGWAGLDDARWVETLFRGGFVNIGRLQFEIMFDDSRGENVANTHIPAGGPIRPEVVADSLLRGGQTLNAAFAEFGPIGTAVCDSWLLDPQLASLLPGSNMAAFGALWELETSGPGDDDALYFVFDVPRGNGSRLAELLPRLTARSRLQAALLDLWRSGGGIRCHRGYLDLPGIS